MHKRRRNVCYGTFTPKKGTKYFLKAEHDSEMIYI
jgi:hypothetical protein